MSTKLSVNVNKIALLRNARGENLPNVKNYKIQIYQGYNLVNKLILN